MKYRLENVSAKKSNEIFHSIVITYKLYSVKNNGNVGGCLGTNQNLDKLLTKNQEWMNSKEKYVVRKVVVERHEEPVFNVIYNRSKK